jgi:cytochrome c biogenesis protein CcmG, thiol:disulfide interchange protein DsbE
MAVFMRALKFLIPLAVFAGIAVFLMKGLQHDPRELPSPLLGKAVPSFELPRLDDPQARFSPAQMRGRVWLLNVWGSWCSTCQIEHPVLIALARQSALPIVGMAWKDMPDRSAAWLRQFGNPYTLSIMDFDGRVAIDLGVYGAPETFVFDAQGILRFKHAGALSQELLDRELLPLVRKLQTAAGQ